MATESLSPPRVVFPLEAIRRLDDELLRLLRSLDPGGWSRRAGRAWTVRDAAAHLLDGSLRRLSLDRDGFVAEIDPPPSEAFDDVRAFLDRLNAEWIRAAKRLSPRVLLELLEPTNDRVREHFASLDPEGVAAFPVAWAGQESSPAWLDVAREYTEKWHHQHQIRASVGAPELDDPALLEPLLRTLVWAVPPAYAGIEADPGTVVALAATDEVDLAWAIRAEADRWVLYEAAGDLEADARVEVDGRALWKLLLRADVEAAGELANVRGPAELVVPLFTAVGVMVPRPSDR